MEWAAIGAVAAIAGFGLAFATFWLTFGQQIGAAKLLASQAQEDAKEANDRTSVMSASLALFREQVAREYIHREAMREMEDRLTQAIDRLGDRLDRFVEAAARK